MTLESFLQSQFLWLYVICIASLLTQIFYHLVFFIRLSFYKSKELDKNDPVSIIICARNEEDNLRNFLSLILQQEYKTFEVIVVNDCSWDGSSDFLKELAAQYPGILKIAEIKEVEGREHGKKFALTIGIKAAQYETLLLTDADCYPEGKFWIQKMMNAYHSDEIGIVLGYGKYAKDKGLLNLFIRFDTFQIGVMYLSRALAKAAYMGVGRNMSYKKSYFFKNKGFASHMHLTSGDDDLFVNEISNSVNTAIAIDPSCHTVSMAKQSWKAWFRQKMRHHTTARYYQTRDKVVLFTYLLSLYLFYLSIIALAFLDGNMFILFSIFLLRSVVQIIILQTCAHKLNEKDLGWISPLLELIRYLVINPIFSIFSLFARPKKWK